MVGRQEKRLTKAMNKEYNRGMYNGRSSMELRLYQQSSKKKVVFTPLVEGEVKLYVCGPTVYSTAHIGNARPAVVFDCLARLLRSLYH